MATLGFKGKRFALLEGESVLDGLLRGGEDVSHGCRTGACRACAMVCTAGHVPPQATSGLREVEQRAGMFLACQCRPEQDLELRECGNVASVATEILEIERLTDSVVRVRLRAPEGFDYEAGQYLSLRRADGHARSYSLASVRGEPWLELHIRRIAGGRMSSWLYDEARVGETLRIQGPYGRCCYEVALRDRPLLLVGVGTGLAPIWGVVRAALAAGHRGPITVIPAALEARGLYMLDALEALAEAHPQLTLRPCVLRGAVGPGIELASVEKLVPELVSEGAGEWGAYVCGDAQLVHRLRLSLFMAGVSARNIFADPFLPGETAAPAASADKAAKATPSTAS